MKKIQVGFLLSYDYLKLKYSIPPVYALADTIYIAIDENCRLWSGNTFEIDPEFFDWVKSFDSEGKIIIYRDNFYLPELTTLENDTRERQMLSEKMGVGNWLIQVDADEYFLDFSNFVDSLRKYDHYLENPKKTPVQIAGFLLNLYKYVDGGVLYVNEPSKVLLATNFPNYKKARQTKERIIYTRNLILHESLARSEDELILKLKNWGHNAEIDFETFLNKWKSVNASNYQEMENFFYLNPELWKHLSFVKGNKVEDFREVLQLEMKEQPSNWFLFRKNLGQYFKHIAKFI